MTTLWVSGFQGDVAVALHSVDKELEALELFHLYSGLGIAAVVDGELQHVESVARFTGWNHSLAEHPSPAGVLQVQGGFEQVVRLEGLAVYTYGVHQYGLLQHDGASVAEGCHLACGCLH